MVADSAVEESQEGAKSSRVNTAMGCIYSVQGQSLVYKYFK